MGDLQCGTLVVPLNYAIRRGPTIPIAVARHPAEDPAARIGSLVIDPGGPGVSGLDDIANELSVLTPGSPRRLRHRHVRSPRRGAKRSRRVRLSDPSEPNVTSDPVPDTPAEIKSTIAALREFAGDCEDTVPTLLPYVGTVDVARDMDRLRQALGDSQLTYMGQSYGTLLGLTYAQLFPTHVRAMVLDGVIDPALTFNQVSQGQAQGFESVLGQFFSLVRRHVSVSVAPIRRPDHRVVGAAGRHAGQQPEPDVRGGPALRRSPRRALFARRLAPARRHPRRRRGGEHARRLPPCPSTTTPSGSTNADDAVTAIDCLDHPTSHDLASYSYLADVFKASAPVFGPLLAWGQAQCAVWPAAPTRPVGPVAAAGAPPILVVGTTGDPATPYQWAVDVSHQLARSSLLTVEGDDHVAYFYSGCVRDDVQSYLVSWGHAGGRSDLLAE